jgi:carboxylesterase
MTTAPSSRRIDASVPAVLLLHGLSANPMELASVAAPLRRAGYEVRTPCLPGYGVPMESGQAATPVTPYENWLEQACAHFDELAAKHEQVVLGGLCIGAVLALALARKRQPAALVLISTTLHFDGWNISRWRKLLPLAYIPPARYWMSFPERPPYGIKNPRTRKFIEYAMRERSVSVAGAASLSAAALYQTERMIRMVRKSLGEVRAPSVILQSTHDDMTSSRSVDDLVKGLPIAPEVHWFENSYHMITLDNDRLEASRTVREYLSRHVPVSARKAA